MKPAHPPSRAKLLELLDNAPSEAFGKVLAMIYTMDVGTLGGYQPAARESIVAMQKEAAHIVAQLEGGGTHGRR